jgi:hypothetical protein
VRFCGEIILPRTPPLLASRSGGSYDSRAAVTWRAPKRALAEVSDTVTATSNQPRTGDRKASQVGVVHSIELGLLELR